MSALILKQPETEKEKSVLVDIALQHQTRDSLFTPEYLTVLGTWFFSKKALEEQDVKMWTAVQEIVLKQEKQYLDRQKLEHEIEAEWAARETKPDDLTHEEKEKAMDQILGIAA